MKGILIGLFIILALIVLLVLMLVGAYNKLVKLNISCDEAFATMDVYLKKRFDLIPNLVAAVKGYSKHEAETLERVIQARNMGASQSPGERMQEETEITKSLRQIFSLTESYPDLKANQNFMQLTEQLKNVENDISNSRKYYNGTVRLYNTAVMSVPTNMIAAMSGHKQRLMFEVDNVQERQNVKVEF